MDDWARIPLPIEAETDRPTTPPILASVGLEVRIVKVKPTKGSAYRKYIEYRMPP